MIRRLIELLSLTAVGGSAALALGAEPLQLIGGAGTGAMIWLMIDQHRLGRFRDWLRQAHPAAPPNLPDDWTELIERSQKGFTLLQRETRKVEDRLQQLIAAFEASPNGLLVLDSAERIILCNQAVAEHLGFDVKRDLGQHLRNLVRDPGETIARFASGGPDFILSPDAVEGGGLLLGFRLNLGNDLGMLSLTGDAELLEDYVRYSLLLRASFRF